MLQFKMTVFLKTHEGIDVGGLRLTEEILAIASKYPCLKRFSIIGHSLGGLYARYAIGRLYIKGFFDKLTATNYISVATPHLGCRRSPRYFVNGMVQYITKGLFSQTGTQLTLEDGNNPLLKQMASQDSPYYKGLALFSQRLLYANVFNDLTVPYSTAAILPYNPYANNEKEVILSAVYPHILDRTMQSWRIIASNEMDYFRNDAKAPILREMYKNLNQLDWIRVDVKVEGIFNHETIISKKKFGLERTYTDISDHILDTLVV